jgi:flagellar biosynthetic protein FliO
LGGIAFAPLGSDQSIEPPIGAQKVKRFLTLVTTVMIGLSSMSCHVLAQTQRSDTTIVTVSNPVASPTGPAVALADSARETAESSSSPDSTAQASTLALPTDTELTDTAGLVVRTGLSLVAVILLIWGAVQILKKLSPGGTSSAPGSHIRVLDRAHIAPKKSIFVVQVGGKAIAVGMTDQQMTLLTDLDLEDTLERYAETPTIPVSQRFSEVLKTMNLRLGRGTEPVRQTEPVLGTVEPAT